MRPQPFEYRDRSGITIHLDSKISSETRRKLLKLSKLIETVPDEQFDMDYWVKSGRLLSGVPGECGTTACAAGWAATIPEFKRAGFCLSEHHDGSLVPSFKGRTETYAIEKFFDLSRKDAMFLFQVKCMTTKEYVMRLRAFIETNSKP